MTETTAVAVRQPTMVLSDVSKSYAGVAALTDVSLEVLPGEVHALLGENGAGKSTLMGVASGTIQPDAGVLTLDGEQHASLNPAAATRSGIAIVHQHPAVLPDLTVAENLRLALPPHVLTADGRSERDGMRAVLDEIDLAGPPRGAGRTASRSPRSTCSSWPRRSPYARGCSSSTSPPRRSAPTRSTCSSSGCGPLAASGTAVIYITHRLAEVRMLAAARHRPARRPPARQQPRSTTSPTTSCWR